MNFEDWLTLGTETLSNLNDPRFNLLQGFVESRQKLKIVFEDGQVDEVESGSESGLGITATRDQNTNFFCFSHPDRCRQEESNIRALLGVEDPSPVEFSSRPQVESMPVEQELDAAPDGTKVDRVRSADELARSYDDRVDQVRVTYSQKKRRIAVLDREGWIHEEPQQYLSFNVLVIGRENGRRERGYGRLAGYQGEEIFTETSAGELAEEAAEQAMTALEAESVEAGPSTVVIGPGFGGTIFHEACGHGFEADHIFEDVSQYSGRMGEQVASESVTFVDDATLENHYGAYCYDDEGTPAQRNVLIKDGVMQSVMSDRKYAHLLDVDPSGNGRRESYTDPVLPRMTNTFIEAGETDPETIIEDTEDGIYAAHIGGGQVDPASGDFIFSITEGYQIEDGSLGKPIRDAALVGNGPDVLNRIDAVGHDLEMRPGVCGKGQWVPVTVGQPTLRVRELTVGGEDS